MPTHECERQTVQALVPHLAETWNLCRLRSVAGSFGLDICPSARALCDCKGRLHAAAPAFTTLLRAEWPEWQGPKLPEMLQGNWLRPEHSQYVGAAIVANSEPVGDLRLLKLRHVSLLDTLTAREQEVARLFGSGSSHKSIANCIFHPSRSGTTCSPSTANSA